ncbi:MAG: hypothetical protein RI947_477 [Candidatus Parcubacteria bacterium]|jgi:hypothetical protein
MDTDNGMQNDKKVIVMAGFLGSVLVILMVATFILSNLQKSRSFGTQTAANDVGTKTQTVDLNRQPVEESTSPATSTPNGTLAEAPQPLPHINFRTWDDVNSVALTRTSAPVYELNQSYTFEEVRDIASTLGASDSIKKKRTNVIAYKVDSTNKTASLLQFDTQNGEFTYTSTPGQTLPEASDINTGIYEFMKTINIYDASLKVTATYKNKAYPELTFYEVHRDWSAVSAPILNTVGLLNLSEKQALNSLTLATANAESPENTDICATSDGKDGLERQKDFNTMTLALTEDKRIKFAQSNIRRLNATAPREVSLINYDEAKKKLQEKKYSFLLTTPAGSGAVQWTNIYPQNQANAQEAVITEAALSYLESAPATTQSELAPYYVFKGYSQLDSGFRVNYIAAVPAIVDETTQSRNIFSPFIKEVHAQQSPDGDNGQKQGSFDLSPSPSVQPTPVDETSCNPTAAQLNPVYEINGTKFGWANVRVWQGKLSTGKRGWWYLIPKPSTTDATLKDEVNQVVLQVRSLANESDFREFDKILLDFQLRGNSCPVRVTGASPSIFVYGDEGQKVSVASGAQLTYADPVTTGHNTWNVTITADGLDVNGLTRPYIYYEYKPVAFTKPSHGWVVRKDQLPALATSVSQELGLTSDETTRALFELNHAASSVSHDLLYVGLVNTQELNARLPLTVSPTPNHTYRYHFFVAKAQNSDRTSAPHLSSVVRSGLTLIEIGSSNQ